MEAIVLAGGLGTRLRSAVPDLPKPMAPIRGRPFLSLILDELDGAGFTAAILAVGYRHEAIHAHFGERYKNIDLRYSVEQEPLGTGGAMRLAWPLSTSSPLFALNGDTFLALDYRAMLAAHQRGGAQLSMAVRAVADVSRYGALELAGGSVRGFREKGPGGPGWINGGVYVMGPALRERMPAAGGFSFEQDLLVPHVRDLRPLAFRTEGLFIDIGVPDDYARAQTLFPAAP